jgi:hypothetical protein
VEQHEPHRSAQHQHRDPSELQARGERLGARGRRLAGAQHELARQAERCPQRDAEQHGAVRQRRRGPDEELQTGGGDDGHRAGDPGDHAQLGVRLDQFSLTADHRRHQCRLRHRVRLLEHECDEDEQEQPDVVGEPDHQELHHDARTGDRLHHEPAAAAHPVDQRSDERGDEEERAKLTSRNASTLLRAPLGSTSKKNESARATTIAASPPIIAAWVRASCWNFDDVPAATPRS